jgi:hypothetical protein
VLLACRCTGATQVTAPALDRRPDDATITTPRLGASRRRVQLPAVLIGVLLIAGGALAFGLVADRLSDRQPVLVLARPVERGAVLADADLAIAQVAADAGVQVTPPSARRTIVGRTLLTPLPAGAVVTADLVGAAAIDLGAGARTVGLALEPGGYPTSALAPGDLVGIVATDGAGSVLDDRATVVAVEPVVEGSATLLVSVVVRADAATAVTAAAARDGVRLVLRGDRP